MSLEDGLEKAAGLSPSNSDSGEVVRALVGLASNKDNKKPASHNHGLLAFLADPKTTALDPPP